MARAVRSSPDLSRSSINDFCKITQGHTISAYYSIEDDVNNSGATYLEPCVVSKNIVSSPIMTTDLLKNGGFYGKIQRIKKL